MIETVRFEALHKDGLAWELLPTGRACLQSINEREKGSGRQSDKVNEPRKLRESNFFD